MEILGRTAVVTGASGGIGAATAVALAKDGATVILLARSADKLNNLVADIAAKGGKARAFAVDLTDPKAVEQAAAAVLAEFGAPDILVNNAGAGRFLYAEETPPEEAVAMMASPYFAAFFTTRAFLPAMLKKGEGWVVNVTSPSALLAFPGMTGYTAARWAMRGFHEALKADFRGTRLRAMLVVPGKVKSDYFSNNPGSESRIPGLAKLTPTLSPDDVGRAIVHGLRRRRSVVMVPAMVRLLYILHHLCPPLVEALVAATGHKRKA